MTVLLVLGTFLVFIVLDYFLNRRKAIHTVSVEAHTAAAARFGSDYVDGFLVPAKRFVSQRAQLAGAGAPERSARGGG